MSRPSAYDEPYGSQPSHGYASESDDDLDLTELDPNTTSTVHPQRQKNTHNYASRVPLRNLRMGRQRQAVDRSQEDAEDLEALVSPAEGRKRSSLNWSRDGQPLLNTDRVRRLSQQAADSLFELSQRPGIWRRLIPFQGQAGGIALPADAIEDTDVEDDGRSTRSIAVGSKQTTRYPPNAISNAKYTPWSFLPRTLFNEFKFFFNLYFLLVALSQIIPQLRIGYLLTYIAPLAFVLSITLGKEAYDDIYRRQRDAEANSEAYTVLRFSLARPYDDAAPRQAKLASQTDRGKSKHTTRDRLSEASEEEQYIETQPNSHVDELLKPARELKVGDVVVLRKDQRIPADVVILKSISAETDRSAQSGSISYGAPSDEAESLLQTQAARGADLTNETTTADAAAGGEAFIRTDQLDGETDWKLRLASPLSQTLSLTEFRRLRITAGKPDKRVNDFVGTILLDELMQPNQESLPQDHADRSAPLTIDHVAWANTVLASSTIVYAAVVYTGSQTRAALSTSASRSKNGLLELELNSLTKILCFLTAFLSILLVALERVHPTPTKGADPDTPWYVAAMRFLILFSSIVPISLRVNLDMGKSIYAYFIHHDKGIPDTVVRTSTIPEDLGRIEYLLSDKTGTLTRNEMELKKVHVGTVSYGGDAMEEVTATIRQAFGTLDTLYSPADAFAAISTAPRSKRDIGLRVRDLVLALAICHNVTPTVDEDDSGAPCISYQASSPDEIAIVQWTEHVGLRLASRDRHSITLQHTSTGRTVVKVRILYIFPFTSDSKRMGIIAQFQRDGGNDGLEEEIVFYQKGADTVMSAIVASNDWLDEETGNMAREGLRTLVIARKTLSSTQLAQFSSAYSQAALNLTNRDTEMGKVVKQYLEHDLELLGVTGVEDKLQPNVKPSLELLRNAGIKIWMLTGDKVETARCVAINSKLVFRGQHIHTIAGLRHKDLALEALSPLSSTPNTALLIDGQSLALYLAHHRQAFISTAVRLPAVIACRCSPTQKAAVALLIRAYTKKRVACIGDGGNDVSMIQAADVGIGIVGKEGKQASLAADFSITQFAYLTKLILWHGRNSYKRSAKLAQFVMHRGLIISVAQAVFSIAARFEPIALYRDWLLVGYATLYTMAPVFSLVLDRDVDEGIANLYPELYKELTLGKSLSYRTFFVWVAISLYQGIVIQLGSQLLVPKFSTSAPTTAHSTANAGDSGPFARMVLLSYSALITNEIIMVAASVTTWHIVMLLSILGTLGVYFGSLPFLGSYFDLAWLSTLSFWWRFAVICGISLVPVWGGRVIKAYLRPPSYRKIQG